MSSTSHQGVEALSGSFLGITSIIIGLRFFARYKHKAELKADDWAVLAAYAFFIGTVTATLVGVKHRLLGYPPTKDPAKAQGGKKFAFLLYISFDLLSTATYASIKISALFFYKRIFCPRGRHSPFGMVIWASIAIVAIWAILFMIILPIQCGNKLSVLWSPVAGVMSTACKHHDSQSKVEAWVVTDVILDGLIIILPMPSIWRLNFSIRRKIAITGVFLFAFVGWGASITRMGIFIKEISDVRSGRVKQANPDSEVLLEFYTILSAGMCLTAVNLPSVWLLFSKSKVPEKVLHSIRSLVSLRSTSSSKASGSLFSKHSREADSGRPSQDKGFSIAKFNPDAANYEAHALSDADTDLEKGEDVPPVPPVGNIMIRDTVIQSSERRH